MCILSYIMSSWKSKNKFYVLIGTSFRLWHKPNSTNLHLPYDYYYEIEAKQKFKPCCFIPLCQNPSNKWTMQ